MVLLSGIEPPTSPLPRVCSTTELQQRAISEQDTMTVSDAFQALLLPRSCLSYARTMSDKEQQRQEKQAKREKALRENLMRRKKAAANRPQDKQGA